MKIRTDNPPTVAPSVAEAEKADGDVHYVLGSNGAFKVAKIGGKDDPVEALAVRRTYKPSLDPIKPDLTLKRITPIPRPMILKALAIFRKAYERWRSEFIVVLRWRNGEYRMEPADFGAVGPGALHYHISGATVGTIHSHGSMGAFFSGTDDGDDLENPGIHIVMGNVSSHSPSAVGSFTAEGSRLSLSVKPIQQEEVFDISDKEFDRFAKHFQSLEEIEGKTQGYYVKDARGNILQWKRKKKSAERLAGDTYEVEKARKPRGWGWKTTYGPGFSFDSDIRRSYKSLNTTFNRSAHGFKRPKPVSPRGKTAKQFANETLFRRVRNTLAPTRPEVVAHALLDIHGPDVWDFIRSMSKTVADASWDEDEEEMDALEEQEPTNLNTLFGPDDRPIMRDDMPPIPDPDVEEQYWEEFFEKGGK